jgi:glycosyltransferase involved in cell wall biosynthesis
VSGVVVDLQGTQSASHAERGIARYLTGLALGLEERHRSLVASFVLNPERSTPSSLEPLVESGRLGRLDQELIGSASAFHIGSPIELDASLEQLWPAATRRLPLVVTLYDLIPEVFAGHYLANPLVRRTYRARLQLLHSAARVLAISEATARDAVAHLGLAPHRVVAVGAAVAEQFRPPERREDAVDAVVGRLPFVRPGFVLYTGGIEFRKNIDRLLVGYSSLPARLRNEHQLVIVCRVAPPMRRAIEARLSELGLAQHVAFPGVVADPDLVLLYQAAELFVFPSLYEGFGLPVAEAMACGAPVIAGRTSSLVELVQDDEALFEPTEAPAIARALRRALEDSELRDRLRTRGLHRHWRWADVADRTAAVYDDVSRTRKRRGRPRPRIAFVSPLPPQMSGVADYSYRLLAELTEFVDVDVFCDVGCGPATAPGDLPVRPTQAFTRVEGARGGYDEVLACIGNSDHHAETLALLRKRPSSVLAHDVRLTGLYSWVSRRRPDLEHRTFRELLHELHPRPLPSDLGQRGWLEYPEYEKYGVLLVREMIARSTRFLVHSEYAAGLARLDARASDAGKVSVVSFGYPLPSTNVELSDAPLVATFGLVAPVKQTDRIVEAVALVAERHPATRFTIVGPVSEEHSRQLRADADRLGVAGRLVVTGELPSEEFNAWIARTSVAVQLRAASNGETSASLADCLAAGVPTIATAVGSTGELPEDVYVPVGPDVTAATLAEEIGALLSDPVRRKALSESGRRYAEAHSFAVAAESIVDELFDTRALTRRAA